MTKLNVVLYNKTYDQIKRSSFIIIYYFIIIYSAVSPAT